MALDLQILSHLAKLDAVADSSYDDYQGMIDHCGFLVWFRNRMGFTCSRLVVSCRRLGCSAVLGRSWNSLVDEIILN